jgi:KaiC/GvpD/RAD55 family RecA-like ATPase
MARGITAKTLLNKKFKTYKFDGIWEKVLGEQERGGIWVIYGNEKNGKTTLAILLAQYLTKFENLNYISAEEGTGFTFQSNLARAKFDFKNTKVKFHDYLQIEEIDAMLSKRQSAKIMVIDNATAYVDDLKTAVLRRLRRLYPDTLFIIMAHMEKNEPTTAMAKLAKKLCNVYFRIEGLTAFVGGRCPGGAITINEDKAMLFHGSEIKN